MKLVGVFWLNVPFIEGGKHRFMKTQNSWPTPELFGKKWCKLKKTESFLLNLAKKLSTWWAGSMIVLEQDQYGHSENLENSENIFCTFRVFKINLKHCVCVHYVLFLNNEIQRPKVQGFRLLWIQYTDTALLILL